MYCSETPNHIKTHQQIVCKGAQKSIIELEIFGDHLVLQQLYRFIDEKNETLNAISKEIKGSG